MLLWTCTLIFGKFSTALLGTTLSPHPHLLLLKNVSKVLFLVGWQKVCQETKSLVENEDLMKGLV